MLNIDEIYNIKNYAIFNKISYIINLTPVSIKNDITVYEINSSNIDDTIEKTNLKYNKEGILIIYDDITFMKTFLVKIFEKYGLLNAKLLIDTLIPN